MNEYEVSKLQRSGAMRLEAERVVGMGCFCRELSLDVVLATEWRIERYVKVDCSDKVDCEKYIDTVFLSG